MVKRFFIFFFIPIISIMILYSLLYLFTSGMCRTSFASEKVFSQDGEYFTQIQDESCGGATGENTTGVIIYSTKSIFSNHEFFTILNVWIGNRKGILSVKGSAPSMKTTWLNDRTLKVSYPSCGSVYGKDTSWRDVKIVYEGSCSSN